MLPKPIHYQSLKNFRCKSPKLWHTKDVLRYTSHQSVCPSSFWPGLSLKYMYRNWAPSRSCPCRWPPLGRVGWALGVFATSGLHMWRAFHHRCCFCLPRRLWLLRAEGGQGTFNDRCSASLSSRRESALSVLALRKEKGALMPWWKGFSREMMLVAGINGKKGHSFTQCNEDGRRKKQDMRRTGLLEWKRTRNASCLLH